MQSAHYYREQASLASRLAKGVTTPETAALLGRLAQDFHDIAVDLERGLINIKHPELLPQRDHPREEPPSHG